MLRTRILTRPLPGPRPAGFAFGKVALRSCCGLTHVLNRGGRGVTSPLDGL
ncbi:MAG: hypothetical protein P4L11_00935 [Geothrix sp.]|nr:hypothetical protein [Geothrix sp.]